MHQSTYAAPRTKQRDGLIPKIKSTVKSEAVELRSYRCCCRCKQSCTYVVQTTSSEILDETTLLLNSEASSDKTAAAAVAVGGHHWVSAVRCLHGVSPARTFERLVLCATSARMIRLRNVHFRPRLIIRTIERVHRELRPSTAYQRIRYLRILLEVGS